ncbi:cytochrome P450 [Daldinia caldariorum]|uniref:cytochrome P450 n=1 Tax=Daldinia caldariorum TaxID=326644 RepID=UPI00200833D8|nr:cytochrome P450 [Daldinia caldariorum]KAI1466290.1 cytochrome P450 [Daldinia caldariorum]
MLRELIYCSIGLVLFAYALDYAFSFADDEREPKRISPKVPLIGHLLGMVKYGVVYFTNTSKQTTAEMYTLPVLNNKVYVCNSLRLMPLIQKNFKTVSFRPWLKTSAERIGGNSHEAVELFGGPLVDDFERIIRLTLEPGPWLDAQNLRMGQSCSALINSLVGGLEGEEGNKVWLLSWVKHLVVQASSCGVYGQEHPFLDPAIVKAFWVFHEHMLAQMASLDFFQRCTKAREVLYQALLKYCAAPPADIAHTVVERQRVLREAGMSFEEAVKQEIVMCVATFINTASTLYWTLWELFSRPEVLAEVREEVEAHAVYRKSGEEKKNKENEDLEEQEEEGKEGEHDAEEADFVLDVAALKTRCPILLSVLQETQRMRHVHANIRKVLSDTPLDDGRYLLRKGYYVIMPAPPIHANTSVWGPSAGTFDPYRFMPSRNKASKSDAGAAAPPSGFLSWGAPPYLCPARQFASTEVLIVTALLAMRVDLTPAASGGKWEANPALNYNELITLCNPAKDVEMRVKPREQGVGKWALKMGESRTRVPIASG